MSLRVVCSASSPGASSPGAGVARAELPRGYRPPLIRHLMTVEALMDGRLRHMMQSGVLVSLKTPRFSAQNRCCEFLDGRTLADCERWQPIVVTAAFRPKAVLQPECFNQRERSVRHPFAGRSGAPAGRAIPSWQTRGSVARGGSQADRRNG